MLEWFGHIEMMNIGRWTKRVHMNKLRKWRVR